MKRISLVVFLLSFLAGCGALNIYQNANDPVDRSGKENWALVSVERGEQGQILISPRPRDNAFYAALSAGNHNARSEILLQPGINDINVYAFNGPRNAVFVLENINIEENGEYVVKYKFDNGRVRAWVHNLKAQSAQSE